MGLNSDIITSDKAFEIFRSAEPEMPALPKAITVYSSTCGLMIFLLHNTPVLFYYAFSDFEALLKAAALCPAGKSSSLFLYGAQYLLAVTPEQGQPEPYILREFGQRLEISELAALHIREQSKVLIAENALAKLCEVFHLPQKH